MTEPDPVDRQLALAWRAFTPPPQLRERVWARLQRGPVARWPALRASGSLGLALGAGVFALGFLVGRFPRNPPPRPLASSREISMPAPARAALPDLAPPPAAPAELALPTPNESQAGPGRSPHRTSKPSARPAARARDWRGELALLQRADRALRGADARLASALLQEFDAGYPHTKLVEERAALGLLARCQERASDAPEQARRFSGAYPNSVYRERIAASCASDAQRAHGALTNSGAPDIQSVEGG